MRRIVLAMVLLVGFSLNLSAISLVQWTAPEIAAFNSNYNAAWSGNTLTATYGPSSTDGNYYGRSSQNGHFFLLAPGAVGISFEVSSTLAVSFADLHIDYPCYANLPNSGFCHTLLWSNSDLQNSNLDLEAWYQYDSVTSAYTAILTTTVNQTTTVNAMFNNHLLFNPSLRNVGLYFLAGSSSSGGVNIDGSTTFGNVSWIFPDQYPTPPPGYQPPLFQTPTPSIPEPSSLILLGIGVAGLAWKRQNG